MAGLTMPLAWLQVRVLPEEVEKSVFLPIFPRTKQPWYNSGWKAVERLDKEQE